MNSKMELEKVSMVWRLWTSSEVRVRSSKGVRDGWYGGSFKKELVERWK